MVRRLTIDGDGVAVVVGAAGSGKTFALAAAREASEASGTPVIGAVVAWRAARGLAEDAGISSTSVASLLARVEHHRLPRRAVVVVDEAVMVGTRQLVDLSRRYGECAASWSWSATIARRPRSRPGDGQLAFSGLEV
jgi:ATP-dependent exoDNAse (exonuclease V) alpha subunit